MSLDFTSVWIYALARLQDTGGGPRARQVRRMGRRGDARRAPVVRHGPRVAGHLRRRERPVRCAALGDAEDVLEVGVRVDEGSSAQPKGSGGCHGRARPYIYGDATTGPAGTASCPGRSPCPGPAGSGTASPPLTPTTRLWTATRSSPTPSERHGARDAAPLAVILTRIPTPNSHLLLKIGQIPRE